MRFNPGRFGATTMAQLRMTFRRRITLFWSLVFPMILMTLLGLLFGRSVTAGDIVVAQPVTAAAPKAMVTALCEITRSSPRPGNTVAGLPHAMRQRRSSDSTVGGKISVRCPALLFGGPSVPH